MASARHSAHISCGLHPPRLSDLTTSILSRVILFHPCRNVSSAFGTTVINTASMPIRNSYLPREGKVYSTWAIELIAFELVLTYHRHHRGSNRPPHQIYRTESHPHPAAPTPRQIHPAGSGIRSQQ